MSAIPLQPAAAQAMRRAGRNSQISGIKQDVAALTLDRRGVIRDCNSTSEALFKYHRSELIERQISLLLPQLAGSELIQDGQVNPRLSFLCRIGRSFQAVTQPGESFSCRLYLNLLDNQQHGGLSLIVCPAQNSAGG